MENEGTFIDLTDEEGNSFTLEIIDDVEYEGELYRVYLPTDIDEDDPDFGYIILKVVTRDGEEMLDSVDDDALRNRVYDRFMEELFSDEDEEE